MHAKLVSPSVHIETREAISDSSSNGTNIPSSPRTKGNLAVHASSFPHGPAKHEVTQRFSTRARAPVVSGRYRTNDKWDDALRVAKFYGGQNAQKRVAYAWALALGGDAGARLLTKQARII